MRIRDWSSDVCSADLFGPRPGPQLAAYGIRLPGPDQRFVGWAALAVAAKPGRALCRRGRSARRGAGGRTGREGLSADRSAGRLVPQPVPRRHTNRIAGSRADAPGLALGLRFYEQARARKSVV